MTEQVEWLCNVVAPLVDRVESINTRTSSFRDNFRRLTDQNTQLRDEIALLRTEVDELRTIIQTPAQPTGSDSAAGSLTSPTTAVPGNFTSGPGVAPSIPRPAAGFGIKLAKPNKFDGTKREESSKFETACRMYLRNVYPSATDDQKIAFIISFLEGTAHDWLEPYMESDFSGHIIPFLHNEALFWDQFKSRYGLVNRDETNRVKLKDLKQKGSVQDYLSLFETYSATLGYNDRALKDMFYDGLSPDVVNDMIAQDFNVSAPTTTCRAVQERALKIDKCRQTVSKKSTTASTTSSARNNNVLFASNTSQATRELLKKGDKVYMIGTDGRAKKGTIAEISKSAKGRSVPKVKWNGESSAIQVPFNALKIDTRPAPSTPQLAKGSGPGPMELDALSIGKGPLLCHGCGGRGHMIRDCPLRNASGHEARIEDIESKEEEESLKGDA